MPVAVTFWPAYPNRYANAVEVVWRVTAGEA